MSKIITTLHISYLLTVILFCSSSTPLHALPHKNIPSSVTHYTVISINDISVVAILAAIVALYYSITTNNSSISPKDSDLTIIHNVNLIEDATSIQLTGNGQVTIGNTKKPIYITGNPTFQNCPSLGDIIINNSSKISFKNCSFDSIYYKPSPLRSVKDFIYNCIGYETTPTITLYNTKINNDNLKYAIHNDGLPNISHDKIYNSTIKLLQ